MSAAGAEVGTTGTRTGSGARWPWIAAPVLAVVGWTAALAGLLWVTAEPAERAAIAAAVEPRLALVAMLVLFAAIAAGAAGRRLHEHLVLAPAQLAGQARVLVAQPDAPPLPRTGRTEIDALAEALDALAAQRTGLRQDIEHRVRAASRDIEQERSRLAALMAELTQSVVVCNLDGRVLLYNARARLQFRALSDAPAAIGGAELLGLGRSIYAVLDRQLVAHALDSIGERLARGADQPSAQFVTSTRSGQLLRVQMAPVRAVMPAPGRVDVADAPAAASDAALVSPAAPVLAGFVLMLDNITRDFRDESLRDRLLHDLSEGSRASLGALQAAVEMLDLPDLDTASRDRFLAVIRDEVGKLGARLRDVSRHATQTQKTRWPLADMQGVDFLGAAARRIESGGRLRVTLVDADPELWLRVDSYSLLQAVVYLAQRLFDEYDIAHVALRLARAVHPGSAPRAHLDLVWTGQAMSTETVMSWELDAIGSGGGAGALTVRDIVDRHGGEFWFERERAHHAAFFRFLLPLAGEREPADLGARASTESRPEYYDFDLFRASEQASELADRPLTDLSCTVFDTETTGLNPSQGDEIIQIGATRIVAGKLRRQECFEQLVDPQRDIPAAGIPIHGIDPSMVEGQPTIDRVLPAFHAFAADTVLVAHNAAFDMRFLQLKEAATGVRFEQPVLDTLLLSAVAHPEQTSHGLEAIAQRLGVTVLGRHTALGDAMVTAEVFLKLIPLLADRGIHTLGQAREASQKTQYARLAY
jgi:DNA polymerase-3 subunit epsilon